MPGAEGAGRPAMNRRTHAPTGLLCNTLSARCLRVFTSPGGAGPPMRRHRLHATPRAPEDGCGAAPARGVAMRQRAAGAATVQRMLVGAITYYTAPVCDRVCRPCLIPARAGRRGFILDTVSGREFGALSGWDEHAFETSRPAGHGPTRRSACAGEGARRYRPFRGVGVGTGGVCPPARELRAGRGRGAAAERIRGSAPPSAAAVLIRPGWASRQRLMLAACDDGMVTCVTRRAPTWANVVAGNELRLALGAEPNLHRPSAQRLPTQSHRTS